MASGGNEQLPLKYPTIFNSANVAVITKMDLAAAVEFNERQAQQNIQAVRPGMRVLGVSAKSGLGMDKFIEALTHHQVVHVAETI